ncbi:MAG TPA: AAA family ATPase [Thermoanaerobaculia bacterium]
MILLLNGAFGIGKTTVARLLVARLPRACLFDPEIIGIALQRSARLAGRTVDDFQDLRSWRKLTITGLRLARAFRPNVVVPMAFSNPAYLDEIRLGIARFERRVFHFCLVAPVEVVHERLSRRTLDPEDAAWQHRRASECCRAHTSEEFATHVTAAGRLPDEIAAELERAVTVA